MMVLGPGDSHPVVGAVKRRLGVFPSDDEFTMDLAAHIRGAQIRLSMEVTGLIEDDLVDRLHINRQSRYLLH